jgi:hypothetical protein
VQIQSLELGELAALELVEGTAKLVIVHGAGPRIAWFGRARNLLYWDDAGARRRGAWALRGGHRLWITRPDADESEETYAPDNAACRVERIAGGVAVSAIGSSQIEKTLAVRSEAGAWVVSHTLRNTGDMLWAGGAWALTCTKPGATTTYRVPLDGGNPAWDALTLVVPRRWGGGHTSRIADPQIVMTEEAIEIHPRGGEAKRMLSAPRGTLEMHDADIVFAKTAVHQPGARYPLDTNVAFYLGPDRFMVELETMSPQRTLRPGESLTHVEIWTLSSAP